MRKFNNTARNVVAPPHSKESLRQWNGFYDGNNNNCDKGSKGEEEEARKTLQRSNSVPTHLMRSEAEASFKPSR
jgi:hypothetical protein